MHNVLETTNNIYLVVDYCNKGDFTNYLRSKNLRYLPEKDAVFFLKQIMNGFAELRKYHIIHRDFKLSNILINDETLKIGDFGLAKRGKEVAKTIVGSQLTMAPEVMMLNEQGSYTAKADLWSVGFVYYQMLFGEYPFFGLTPTEILQNIKQKSGNLSFPRPVSQESKNLINQLLVMQPEKRIDWPDFFKHPLFKVNFQTSLRDLKKHGKFRHRNSAGK